MKYMIRMVGVGIVFLCLQGCSDHRYEVNYQYPGEVTAFLTDVRHRDDQWFRTNRGQHSVECAESWSTERKQQIEAYCHRAKVNPYRGTDMMKYVTSRQGK